MNTDVLTIIMIAVLVLSTAGLVFLGAWLFKRGPSSKMSGRINRYLSTQDETNDSDQRSREFQLFSPGSVGRFRGRLNESLSGLSSEKLQIKLSSAYWQISDTEFILIRAIATIFGFIFGWLIPGNILGGIFLGVICFMVPPIVLERSITQRQQKFHNQLLDVLVMIKGAVQAGYSLPQSLDLAVREITPPSSEEFARVLKEVRFGLPFEQALYNLAERMEDDDLQIVITAIIINAQVGGNLSTVLEATIETIRDRMHLFGEIRSLTSYARYVGNFLTLLPFIAGFAIFMLSPDYFNTLKDSIITQMILLLALVGVIIGNIWIRQVVKIRV